MASFFFLIAVINAFAVLGVLIAGFAVMSKGGDTAKKYSNKLMQLRVWLQGTTLLFLALAMLSNNHS
jgi:hypothetical protein